MKKFKKLIPAFCMLLISAVLMGTSTFAWFSMNTQVAASGMQVRAATSKNLVISTDGTTWSNSAEKASASLTMIPCSSANGINFWSPNKNAKAYNDYALDSSDATSATWSDKKTDSNYVLKTTYHIKTESDEYTTLWVSGITVSQQNGGTDDISKSLRVAVQYGTGVVRIYAPGYSDAQTYDAATGTTGAGWSQSITTSLTGDTAKVSLGSVNTTSIECNVWIWFEGQDTNCTSANSTIATDEYDVEITFKAE